MEDVLLACDGAGYPKRDACHIKICHGGIEIDSTYASSIIIWISFGNTHNVGISAIVFQCNGVNVLYEWRLCFNLDIWISYDFNSTFRKGGNDFGLKFKIVVSDTQAYKQFGNSVVVPLMTAVAETVVAKMNELEKTIDWQFLSGHIEWAHMVGTQIGHTKTIKRDKGAQRNIDIGCAKTPCIIKN